jgi:prepilin-type N-terminal cleavage/methylation domain-containing protein
MSQRKRKTGGRQRNGFTLTEVLVATVVLLVCLVAIAQLVPASILSNSSSRNDSSAMVFAQQELNQLISRPITDTQYTTDTLLNLCTLATPCLLGDPTQDGTTVGSPVVVVDNHPVINFSIAPVAGYSCTYQDPNDAAGVVYDVRWAVITRAPGGVISSKRFILGATKRGGNTFYVPVTLDTMVAPK